MVEWPTVRLGDLIRIEHGWTFPGAGFTSPSGTLPRIVNIGDFALPYASHLKPQTMREFAGDYPRRFELSSGDILLAMTCQTRDGEILGIPMKVPADGRTYLHNQRLGKVVISRPDAVDPHYLYFLFLDRRFNSYLTSTASGSAILHTAPERIEGYTFHLPPVSDQHAIAEVLGALDDKIDANGTLAEGHQALISGIFSSAMAGQDLRRVNLGEVAEVVFGEPFKSGNFNRAGRGRALIRIRDLKTFTPQVSTDEARSRETLVQPGDILVGMDAEFRPTLWCGRSGLLNQRVCLVRPKVSGRAFARELLIEPLARIEAYKTGTTVSHLNKTDLEDVSVIVPARPAIARFDEICEPLRESIVALWHESELLAALRDTLLPRLLARELPIRDALRAAGKAS